MPASNVTITTGFLEIRRFLTPIGSYPCFWLVSTNQNAATAVLSKFKICNAATFPTKTVGSITILCPSYALEIDTELCFGYSVVFSGAVLFQSVGSLTAVNFIPSLESGQFYVQIYSCF